MLISSHIIIMSTAHLPSLLTRHSIFSPPSSLSSACVRFGLFERLRLADLMVTRVVSGTHTHWQTKAYTFFSRFLSLFACSQANSNVTLMVFASGLSAAPVWQSSSPTLSMNSQRPQCPRKHAATPPGGFEELGKGLCAHPRSP